MLNGRGFGLPSWGIIREHERVVAGQVLGDLIAQPDADVELVCDDVRERIVGEQAIEVLAGNS